jgi:hypothetical protein
MERDLQLHVLWLVSKNFFYLCCIYILLIPLGKFNTILIIIVFNINYLKYP